MGTLEKVMEMQKQGISDTEISTQLKNEGISPAEINDSLNQAKIKNAISPPDTNTQEQPITQGMQSSIMPDPAAQQAQQPAPQPTQPTTQEAPAQQAPYPQPEIYPQQPAPQNDYYQTQAYPQQDYYAPQAGTDTETISEIAEQVVTEKLNTYKKKVGDIQSFRNVIQDKVADIDDRLKRIEDNIDKLQQAIIGKIGEFGENSAMVHKDLENLHGTVAKLMNPLIDNYKELKKISKK